MRQVIVGTLGCIIGLWAGAHTAHLFFAAPDTNTPPLTPDLITFTGKIVEHNTQEKTIDVRIEETAGDTPLFDILRFTYDSNTTFFGRLFVANTTHITYRIRHPQLTPHDLKSGQTISVARDSLKPTELLIENASIITTTIN